MPVRCGEGLQEAATRGLLQQTGLSAALTCKGFYRQLDLKKGSDEVLEDKLFVVYVAESTGEEPHDWPHAINRWMTADEVSKQPKRFDSCIEMLGMVEGKQMSLSENTTYYGSDDF